MSNFDRLKKMLNSITIDGVDTTNSNLANWSTTIDSLQKILNIVGDDKIIDAFRRILLEEIKASQDEGCLKILNMLDQTLGTSKPLNIN